MIFRLAKADLLFGRLVNFCIVAGMVAVVAPLMLLFSLRYGILTNLEHELSANPLNLEIKMLTGYSLKPDFVESLRHNEHVDFAIGVTRSLSVTCDVSFQGKARSAVEAVPSAEGDPVVRWSGLEYDLGTDGAYVSAQLAKELGLKVGDTLKLAVSRQLGGVRQVASTELTVHGILGAAYVSRLQLYLPQSILVAMEDYRDGFDPPPLGAGEKLNPTPRTFSKVRLYAKSLEDVPPLSLMLREHYNISDKLSDIEGIKAIGRVLSTVFWTVAILSASGGLVALGGLIFSNLTRRRLDLALLNLTGLSTAQIYALILLEYSLLGLFAYAISLALYLLAGWAFNWVFAANLQGDQVASTLTFWHLLLALAATVGICALIALACAAFQVRRLKVAAVLRES